MSTSCSSVYQEKTIRPLPKGAILKPLGDVTKHLSLPLGEDCLYKSRGRSLGLHGKAVLYKPAEVNINSTHEALIRCRRSSFLPSEYFHPLLSTRDTLKVRGDGGGFSKDFRSSEAKTGEKMLPNNFCIFVMLLSSHIYYSKFTAKSLKDRHGRDRLKIQLQRWR